MAEMPPEIILIVLAFIGEEGPIETDKVASAPLAKYARIGSSWLVACQRRALLTLRARFRNFREVVPNATQEEVDLPPDFAFELGCELCCAATQNPLL